jgi:carboxypeptidase T
LLASAAWAQVPPVSGAPALEPRGRYWIVAGAKPADLTALGISVEEVQPGRASGVGTGRMAKELAKKGIDFAAVPLEQVFPAMSFPAGDEAFHDYSGVRDELKALASSAPGLASVVSLGSTHKGRELLALRLNTTASGDQPSSKPGVVFMGTHHAREHLSTEIPLLLAKWLVESRAKPDVAKLLASRDVYFIPMVNPDGVEWDIRDDRYHMHRKNLRDNGGGEWALGVDLNRNYDSHWGESGSSTDPESDLYQGPAPFSEPESKAIKAFFEKRPNMKIELTYHSFSELILYPWSWTSDSLDDAKALAAYKRMADVMAGMTGYRAMQSGDFYPSSGDTGDWTWEARKVFAFTFELTPKTSRQGGFYPGAAAIQTTFQANIRPALYLLEMADNPYRAADEAATGAAR